VTNASELKNQDDRRKRHLHGRRQERCASDYGERAKWNRGPYMIPKSADNAPEQAAESQARR
jgi:hypothetical protein